MTEHKNESEYQNNSSSMTEGSTWGTATLPEIERDSVGIPTFVFGDSLGKREKREASGEQTLEVQLLWRDTILKVGHFTKNPEVTIGQHPRNDFPLYPEVLQTERFPLFKKANNDFIVRWTAAMGFEVSDEDLVIQDSESLAKHNKLRVAHTDGVETYEYTLRPSDRVALQLGDYTFVAHYVAPTRKMDRPNVIKTIDLYYTKVLGLTLLLQIFMLAALHLTPLDPLGLSEDLFKNPDRFAKLLLKEEKKEKKKKFELDTKAIQNKDEGKLGKDRFKKKDALASTKGAPKVDPNKREKDRKIALDSGIFSALKGAGAGGAASNVLGPGGLGMGINNALGGLRGAEGGDAGGAGGLGTRGSGPGGSGGSLGIGGLGDGSGYGPGGGTVDLAGRGKGRYNVIPGRTITKGCLTEQQVGRVLSRVHNQARYCYEKELPRNPNLSGKITTQFTIGPTGTVTISRVAESTMGDKAVEDCLLRVIQRLRFPPCAGGGTAEVTYPWIFKSGGN